MFDEKYHDLTVHPAYLSLGSNVGAREAAVLRAAHLLEDLEVGRVVRMSSLYETEPVDCEPMDDFINAAVELRSLLCPEDLLKRLQALENMLGRRGGHNRPRELDIDIVALGDRVIRSGSLTVPHPRYRERSFVLIPLHEIAPGFRCPLTGKRIGDMLGALPREHAVTRVSSRRIVSETTRSPIT